MSLAGSHPPLHPMRPSLRLLFVMGAATVLGPGTAPAIADEIGPKSRLTLTLTPSPTATPSPFPAQALNISTRLHVETGDRVMIGGFIIAGTESKKVVLRGIGPSLSRFGIGDTLIDPTLQLRNSSGVLLMQNNNWRDNFLQASELANLGLGLTDPREAGLVTTLQPGSYTAVMAGNNLTSGIGLTEIYDANTSTASQLANVSMRGFVQTGDHVMIGGFIFGNGSAGSPVIVRGLGPSLSQFELSNALADPMLELRDSNGTLLVANNNWEEHPTQAVQLSAHGLAPTDPLESAIFAVLPAGAFTAILAGADGGSGLGLVEVYGGLQPATLTATNASDSGAGSLRNAVEAALDADTIKFDPTVSRQIINLSSGEIAIDKDITISGPGPGQLTVQRSDAVGTFLGRVFHVMPGHHVVIENLTISNGITDVGGGILTDHATVTINNCRVVNNFADEGGGIYNDGGDSDTVKIVDSLIANNGAYSNQSIVVRGGGIHNRSGAMEVRHSRIIGNGISSAGNNGFGGGLYNDAGTLLILNSLVASNFAFTTQPDPHFHGSGFGIGVYNDSNGTLEIQNSSVNDNYTHDIPFNGYGGAIYNSGVAEIVGTTISGNFPSRNGGGIYNSGVAEVIDSTVRQNSTRRDGGGIYNHSSGVLTVTGSTLNDNTSVQALRGSGGGVANSGAATITNSTFSGNHADSGGGAIHNSGPLTIVNSTLSGNFSYPNGLSSGGNIRNVGSGELHIGNSIVNSDSTDSTVNNLARVVSLGYNICSDEGGGAFVGRGDRINTDPVIGPLQNNGGSTLTHGLLPGSPAIDAGDPNFNPPPFSDQRGPGYNRIYNGLLDIGSIEQQPAPPPPRP